MAKSIAQDIQGAWLKGPAAESLPAARYAFGQSSAQPLPPKPKPAVPGKDWFIPLDDPTPARPNPAHTQKSSPEDTPQQDTGEMIMSNHTQQKAPPIQTLRDGGVVVKLWEQQSQNGPFVTATLGRIYKDKQTGDFRESRSLSATDMEKAQKLMAEASQVMARWNDHYQAQNLNQAQAPDTAYAPNPGQQQTQHHARQTAPDTAGGYTQGQTQVQGQGLDHAQSTATPTAAAQTEAVSQPTPQQDMSALRDQAIANAPPLDQSQAGPGQDPLRSTHQQER